MTHLRNWVTSKYGSLRKELSLKIASLRKNCFWKLGYFEIRLTTKVTHLRNWATSKYDSLRKKLISKIGSLRNLAHFENESFRESGHFGNWVYHFKQVQKLFYKNLKMPGRHPFLFLVEKYCSILMNFGSLCQDSEFGQMRTFEFTQRWQQWLLLKKSRWPIFKTKSVLIWNITKLKKSFISPRLSVVHIWNFKLNISKLTFFLDFYKHLLSFEFCWRI